MTAAPLAASLFTQIWLGRQLGRVGLGEYHTLALFVIVLTSLGLLGFPAAVSQRIAELDEAGAEGRDTAERAGTGIALVLGVMLALVGVAAWIPFSRLFRIPAPVAPEVMAVAVFASILATFVVHVLVARLEVNAATLVIVAQPLAVAAGIVAVSLGAAVDGGTLAAVGFGGSGLASSYHLARLRLVPHLPPTEVLRLAKRSLHATVLAYPSVVTGWVDRTIIGALLGPAALGAFIAASMLVEGIQRMTRAVGEMAVPAYARLSDDPIGSRRVLDSHIRLISSFFIVSGTLFIAAGNGILAALFGEGFVIATTTLRLLAIALLPLGLAIALASQTVGSGIATGWSRTLFVLVPLHVIAAYQATALFHIAGTALAELAVWTVGIVLYAAQARRRGAPIQMRTLAHVAAVAVPLFVAGWYVGLQTFPWGVRAVAALLVAVPVTTFVLVREPEWRVLRRLVPSRLGGA